MSDIIRIKLDWLPDYDISEHGEIRRVTRPQKGPGRNKELPYSLSRFLRTGYWAVRVCLPDGKPKTYHVHRLVCEAFHGAASENQLVAHNDGDPKNSTSTNVRWATQKENHGDKKRHGTHLFGEKIGNSKLREQDVIRIRSMRSEGWILRDIAEFFGVTETTAHHVATGKTWRHVGDGNG